MAYGLLPPNFVWVVQMTGMPGHFADATRCSDCADEDTVPTTFDRERARRFETEAGAKKWCEANQGFEAVPVELFKARPL